VAELPDPMQSRAVLIGTGRYTMLAGIGAVHNNLAALAEMLYTDRFWGLPPGNCAIVQDPVTIAEMLDPVADAAEDATDTLILYYAGHGLVDRRGELYLALVGSDPRRIYSAVPYSHLRDVLLDSRAARRIVILDCCYSGRALGQMAAAASAVADEASAEGTYVLAASAENAVALAPPGKRYTAFTGELLTIIHGGIDNRGPLLDLDTIYQHLLAIMRGKGLPVPQKRDRNTAGQLTLFRNQAFKKLISPTPYQNDVAPRSPHEQPSSFASSRVELKAAMPDPSREVTVVPGVPRYHRADCILIRFMEGGDLEKRTIAKAREGGCTPCRACLPDSQAESGRLRTTESKFQSR
jgi:hypothetical protein